VSVEDILVGSGSVEGDDAQELLNKIENNPSNSGLTWPTLMHNREITNRPSPYYNN